MHILHLADLHLDSDWFDWVANRAPEFDLLVVAGDLQNTFSNIRPQAQAKAVGKWLEQLGCPTVVCSGNHDFWVNDRSGSFDVSAEGGWIRDLRGKGRIVGVDGDLIEFGGKRILLNGWLQTPHAQADILVTHDPHADLPVASPLVLAGHLHISSNLVLQRDGVTVLIAGHDQNAEIPLHWIINTATGWATHSSGEMIRCA